MCSLGPIDNQRSASPLSRSSSGSPPKKGFLSKVLSIIGIRFDTPSPPLSGRVTSSTESLDSLEEIQGVSEEILESAPAQKSSPLTIETEEIQGVSEGVSEEILESAPAQKSYSIAIEAEVIQFDEIQEIKDFVTPNMLMTYGMNQVAQDFPRMIMNNELKLEGVDEMVPSKPQEGLDCLFNCMGISSEERKDPTALYHALEKRGYEKSEIYGYLNTYFSSEKKEEIIQTIVRSLEGRELGELPKERIEFLYLNGVPANWICIIASRCCPITSNEAGEILYEIKDNGTIQQGDPSKLGEKFGISLGEGHLMLATGAEINPQIVRQRLLEKGAFKIGKKNSLALNQVQKNPEYFQEESAMRVKIRRGLQDAIALEGNGFSKEEVSRLIQLVHGSGVEYYRALLNQGFTHQEIAKIMAFSGQSLGKIAYDKVNLKIMEDHDSKYFMQKLIDRLYTFSVDAVHKERVTLKEDLTMGIVPLENMGMTTEEDKEVGTAKIEVKCYPLQNPPTIEVSGEYLL